MIEKAKTIYRFLSPKFQSVFLEYKVTPQPRYGHGSPPHALLFDLVNSNRQLYQQHLESFLKYADNIQMIKDSKEEKNENNPSWNNGYLPGLDIIGLYGIIANYKPQK